MSVQPLTRPELDKIVARDLVECSNEERLYLKSVAIEPSRWVQTKWAADIGGFWAIAVERDRVLWYNEYEEGFNVSRFTVRGVIPDDQYWCNQDPIRLALPELATGENPHGHWGPPEPLSNVIRTPLKRLWKSLFKR